MTIFNDVKESDAVNGVWKGKDHLLPIYAVYTANDLKEITPGMLNTGKGESPAHLQGYLQETKNGTIESLFVSISSLVLKDSFPFCTGSFFINIMMKNDTQFFVANQYEDNN